MFLKKKAKSSPKLFEQDKNIEDEEQDFKTLIIGLSLNSSKLQILSIDFLKKGEFFSDSENISNSQIHITQSEVPRELREETFFKACNV